MKKKVDWYYKMEDFNEEIHLIKKENLDYHIKVFKTLNDIKQDTQQMKEYSNRNMLLICIISVLAGVIFGMNVKIWQPFASDIYGAVNTIQKEIRK